MEKENGIENWLKIKRVQKIDVDLNKLAKEMVTHCTKEGTHLVVCDDDGFCMACGYQETIEDFKN